MTVDDGDISPTYANTSMMLRLSADHSSSLSSPEELYQSFHTNMSQFREPPPYPGPPKPNNQSGQCHSFSGSEASTDVSVSSTENLSSCHRQEPQGEETKVPQTCVGYDMMPNTVLNTSSDYSILARLGMPTSGMDINCASGATNTPQIYVTGNSGVNMPAGLTYPTHSSPSMTGQCYMSSESGISSGSQSSSTLPDVSLNSSQNSTHLPFTSSPIYQSDNDKTRINSSVFSSPSNIDYHNQTIYANYHPQYTLEDSAQVPPYYSPITHQTNFMQQTGQMFPNISPLPPPPEYPGLRHGELLDQPTSRSYELIGNGKATEIPGSRSHPDLSHFWDNSKHLGMLTTTGSGSDRGSHQSLEHCLQDQHFTDIDQIAAQATRMVDFLTEENKNLREKLAIYDRKISKVQKFELEIQKVHDGYQGLVKSSKKRELLELRMKQRLEEELKSLKGVNSGLIRQLEHAGIAVSEHDILASTEPIDSSMVTLLAKHKEILSIKEHQDMEIEAHRNTIQEQRAQIDILRNVQANYQRDEESIRQQTISEYDEVIQRELTSIKAAYEKKEETECAIRQKLEKEVEFCRLHHSPQNSLNTKSDVNASIKKALEEKEAKILQLEKELIKWQEQHLEDSIRKLKLQEAESESVMPRLPAYEQATGSINTEALINEAKVDKLKQMEEIYNANRRMAELEASVKSMQSQLSDKEAMLRVYQHSPMTRSSSVHTIYCTPHHSPRPSLVGTGSLNRQTSHDVSMFLDFKHKKTGSTSALETCSKLSQDDVLEKIQSLKSASKSSSDTEEGPDTIWNV